MTPRRPRAAAALLALLAAACAPRPRLVPPERPIVEPVVPPAAVAEVPLARPAPPRFEDFPATESFTGTPAPVDLASQRWARSYRTTLREGAEKGPNFAGAYTLVTWGCGTQCQRWALVDARDGRVHGFPFDSELGVDFRRDSRLVVVNPPYPDETPSPWRPQTTYWAWDGRNLQRVPSPPPPPFP